MGNLGNISITPQESLQFAQISGDFNPLHLDPVAARRTQFGLTLIHGVCGTLKALDLLLQQSGKDQALASIRVKYSKPVTQGQQLSISSSVVDNEVGSNLRLEIAAAGIRCQVIELVFADTIANFYASTPPLCNSSQIENPCVEATVGSCADLVDQVDLLWNQALMESLFPSATKYLPNAQLATIMATTRIVGMRCPGLHSVYAQLQLDFATGSSPDQRESTSALHYRVASTDARIDRVELEVHNAYAAGKIEAFFRSAPATQAGFEQTSQLVADGEFSSQTALVIGASRGLGEVIAKVLAAGGASVIMTYASGRDDALRVAADIAQHRPAPTVAFYNVLEGACDAQLSELLPSVSHVYYLASPTIAKGDSKQWDPQLFSRFCDFYVHGLASLLEQLSRQPTREDKLHVFIPSSVFLEQKMKGFDEYIAAKSAAETYVERFAASHANWHVFVPRLPRLHTDQTSGIKGTDSQDTLTVIIEQLRAGYREH